MKTAIAKEPRVSIEEGRIKSARFMPSRRPGVNRNPSRSAAGFAEKILEDAAIGTPLHPRQPGKVEFLWRNPANRAEFGVWSGDVHRAFRSAQTEKKVMMRLPAKSLFHKTSREAITVRSSHANDAVGLWREGNFFQHFAGQSRFGGFAGLYPALRELPCTRSIGALAN
ncbi:MAG: hypothetical protein QOH88_2255 [Verrucomicrobiota bacterium]